jgi:ABC-type multidrug transport system ATPase subunit
MGPSGAGKTTLLDILANRNKSGTVAGSILVNGKPIDKSFKRIAGYVFQEDVLLSTMTVRECLMFSANLRLPDCVSHADKVKRVEEVMQELGITHIAERKIGDEMTRGISGGEKRRVSIGMELVISPQLLFLDEPTSGLDASSAYSVVAGLVNLAKKGRTIVFSIHQPRSNIFQKFDEIVLLSGGYIAYAGPAHDAVNYFSKLGYQCPNNYNPADYLIDVLAQAQAEKKILNYEADAPTIGWKPSSTGVNAANNPSIGKYGSMAQQNLNSQPVAYQQQPNQITSDEPDEEEGKAALLQSNIYEDALLPHATSFHSQFLTLSKRAFQNFYRNFYLMPAHYLSAIAMGLLLGAIYYKLGNDIAAVQNRMGSIFFMCSLLGFGAMSSLELFITERAVYVREKANGYYYGLSYFFSKTAFDLIPLRVVPPILMACCAYFLIDLRHGIDHFLWFVLILVLFNLVSGAMCIMIGSIAPSVASGNIMATLFILGGSLFAGHLLNKDSIPVWLSWLKYLSIWNYAFEALLINELSGFPVVVNPKGLKPYNTDGSFWLNELGMNKDRFYLDIIVLACFAVGFIFLSGVLLKFFVREKR